MMAKHIHVKIRPPDEDKQQAEATKTARLRALRLAKEVTDRDAANRAIAAASPKSRGHKLDYRKSGES
jgi:hypothetical protein